MTKSGYVTGPFGKVNTDQVVHLIDQHLLTLGSIWHDFICFMGKTYSQHTAIVR